MEYNSIIYKNICYGVVFFILVTLFIFASYSYPVMGGDSLYYVITAINHALDRGLTNLISSPTFLVGDSSGAGRFLIFPPLYPLLLSWLMPVGTAMGTHMASFIIYAATILLAAFVYKKFFIGDYQKTSWYRVSVYLFSLFSLAAITIWYPGRPETLMRLLVAATLLCLIYHQKRWIWICAGLFLGLALATHPGPIPVFASLIGIFFAFYNPTKKALLLLVFSLGVSLIIFFIITQFFGYGFLETVRGTTHQFSRIIIGGKATEYVNNGSQLAVVPLSRMQNDSLQAIINRLTYGFGFQGIIVPLSLVCLFSVYRHAKNKISAIALFYLFSVAFAISLFIIFIHKTAYLLAFSPLWILIIGYYAVHFQNSKIIKAIILTVIILSSLNFFYRITLFPYFLTSGMSLKTAREIFSGLPLASSQKIGVDSTLWSISENYDRMYNWDNPDDVQYPTTTIIMREGFNGWTDLPKHLSYCELKYDFFTHKKPTLFNIPLDEAIPGYAFSVYDCSSQ